MSSKKRILVVPVAAVGHVNACIGLCKSLIPKYEIAFLLDETFRNKVSPNGFQEFIYESKCESLNPGDDLAKQLLDNDILGQPDPLIVFENMVNFWEKSKESKQKLIDAENGCKKIIETFKPDLIITDYGIVLPSINYSGKPWINNISAVPYFLFNESDEIPPCCTGFPSDSDPEGWKPYKALLRKARYNPLIVDEFEKLGYPRNPDNDIMPQTQILTVYAFPQEYNFPTIQSQPNWFNIEVYNKNSDQQRIEIKDLVPKEFYEDTLDGKFTGKYIYLSMGSMGSADLNLMDRLIKTLSKTNHKYIVSKGPKFNEYQLARNMWGDRYLPQVKLLPSVDLVITHGGNNTVTETFAQSKPMVILPLFGDQPDNAQRLQETGYGIRLDPYKFTEQQLIKAVDDLLTNTELHQKLKKASERILKTDRHAEFAKIVDQILENNK